MLQRIEPDPVKGRKKFLQIRGRKWLAMGGVEHGRADFQNRFPGPTELGKILNPDDHSADTREIIHGRITAEHDAVFQHRNMIAGVSRGFNDLKGNMHFPEGFGINRDQTVQEFFPEWRIPVCAFAEHCENQTEEICEATGAASLKGILPAL